MKEENKRIIKWTLFCIACLLIIGGLVNAVKESDRNKIKCDEDITRKIVKETSWDKFQVCKYTDTNNKTWTIIRHK